MPTISATHDNIRVEIYVEPMIGCCGAVLLKNFATSVAINSSVKDTCREILYRKLGSALARSMNSSFSSRGLLVATDAVDEFLTGESRVTAYAVSSATRCINMSLGDFCEYHGFSRSSLALNKNTGNTIAAYTLAYRGRSGRATKKIKKYSEPARPRTLSASAESVCAAVQEIFSGE